MQRTNVWTPRGKEGGRDAWGDQMNRETGTDMYTLVILCIKWITNEKLLSSTGNSTQCSVVP